ncbi:MAG: DJ-1/PfpI family protein [Actinomycetota bacterium]
MTETAPKTVAFVLYPGLTPLDIIGPLQVFGMLQMFTNEFLPVVVGATREPVPTDLPVGLSASATFEEIPDPWAIIVPGGGGPPIAALGDEQLLDYIRSAAETAEVVGSVCTGSLLLAAAGLLDGKTATTHWGFWQLLEKLGAIYTPERWVQNGRYITSAGISAGIDMALHLVAQLAGEEIARQVQLTLEYDPAPPFGGIDWTKVDRNMMVPMIRGWVQDGLKDRPALLAKLSIAAAETEARAAVKANGARELEYR